MMRFPTPVMPNPSPGRIRPAAASAIGKIAMQGCTATGDFLLMGRDGVITQGDVGFKQNKIGTASRIGCMDKGWRSGLAIEPPRGRKECPGRAVFDVDLWQGDARHDKPISGADE